MSCQECIGLLGGTFDPVHQGHLTLAEAARKQCGLDAVLFIPAPRPPHKETPQAAFSHRVAMLELALAGRNNMSISLLEAEHPSPSYTVETLKTLRTRLERQCFSLILGADSLLEFHLWRQYHDILRLADLIVCARPGCRDEVVKEAIAALPGPFRPEVNGRYRRPDGRRLYYLDKVRIDLSSSRIRGLLAEGKRPDGLPETVYRYIRSNGLYRREGRKTRGGAAGPQSE